MKQFKNKYIYITILKNNTELYYTCAYVTEVSSTHISFIDILHNNEPFFYNIKDVLECKLSNKVDANGKLKEAQNG